MSYFYAGYYLFRIFTCSLFCFTCSFFYSTCSFLGGLYKFCLSILCFLVYFFIQACVFFIYLVSFLLSLCLFYPKPLSKKDTTPVSFALFRARFYICLTFLLSPFHIFFFDIMRISRGVDSHTIKKALSSKVLILKEKSRGCYWT